MRGIVSSVLALSLLAACQNDRGAAEKADWVPQLDTSFDCSELPEVTAAQHVAPDGIFDDFIYMFMQDASLQRERIHFPLKCVIDGKETQIAAQDWKHDSIYSGQCEMTLIFDGKEIQDEVGDASVKSAIVEMVDLQSERITLYHFLRTEKYWILNEIRQGSLNADSGRDFYVFYRRFVTDEAFQLKHIHDPFYFKTFDSDSFEEIEGWLDDVQWPDYRPFLPADKISNIVYDGKFPKSNYRSFVISSPSSGMNSILLFKRKGTDWELVRLEN